PAELRECRVSAFIVCLLRTDGAVQGAFPCILGPHDGSLDPQISLAMQTRDRNLGSHGGRCERFLAPRTQKSATGKFNSGVRPETDQHCTDCATQQIGPLDFRNGSDSVLLTMSAARPL